MRIRPAGGRRSLRLPELTVEVVGGADQRQVREGLGDADSEAPWTISPLRTP